METQKSESEMQSKNKNRTRKVIGIIASLIVFAIAVQAIIFFSKVIIGVGINLFDVATPGSERAVQTTEDIINIISVVGGILLARICYRKIAGKGFQNKIIK